MKTKFNFDAREPYELESFGYTTPRLLKQSRERLSVKLRVFERQISKAKEISDWLKGVMEKNGGKLF